MARVSEVDSSAEVLAIATALGDPVDATCTESSDRTVPFVEDHVCTYKDQRSREKVRLR